MTEQAVANTLPATWRPPTLPEGWRMRAVFFDAAWSDGPWLEIELERLYPFGPGRANLRFRTPEECMRQLAALVLVAPSVSPEQMQGIDLAIDVRVEPGRLW